MQLQPFRLLEEFFGGGDPSCTRDGTANGAARALLAWYILFQELLYRLEDGGAVGRIPVTEIPVFMRAFERVAPDAEAQQKLYGRFNEVRLLQVQGDDVVCPRFMSLHGGVSAGPRSAPQTGGDMKAFNSKVKRATNQIFQQTLAIPESILVDADKEPLPPETITRLTRLVVVCDNALFKPQRPTVGYTEALIQSGLRVLKKYSDEEIDHVARTVVKNRNHPMFNGINTEKLLEMFGEIVPKLQAA